jgi:hypothetical protein
MVRQCASRGTRVVFQHCINLYDEKWLPDIRKHVSLTSSYLTVSIAVNNVQFSP